MQEFDYARATDPFGAIARANQGPAAPTSAGAPISSTSCGKTSSILVQSST